MGEDITKVKSIEEIEVERFLDDLDMERLEWDRILEDIYPEQIPSKPEASPVHKDTDPIQAWMAKERE